MQGLETLLGLNATTPHPCLAALLTLCTPRRQRINSSAYVHRLWVSNLLEACVVTIHDPTNAPAHALADTACKFLQLHISSPGIPAATTKSAPNGISIMMAAYNRCPPCKYCKQLQSSYATVLCMASSDHLYLCMSSHMEQ